MMTFEEWAEIATAAWNAGEQLDIEKAFELYAKAEQEKDRRMTFSPTLNVLRHALGDNDFFDKVEGTVTAVPPSEDAVFGIQSMGSIHPMVSARGMKKTKIDQAQLEKNIRKFHFDAGYHMKNLRRLQPHVMVMSTGRCGTMSLYRLLQQTQYIPHHQFVYNTNHVYRMEQMCRFIEGNYQNSDVIDFWMKTRAAEWLGAMINDSPMAICGHYDTIFAPAFALVHRGSKIVYLRRDPKKVFASMYGKNQWREQIGPIFYKFDDEGHWDWKDQDLDTPEQIVWYLKFTEAFSRALGNVISDRWIEISSDKLFAQDEDEIRRLVDFAELDIPFNDAVGHFGNVYNRKAHKDVAYDKGLELFEEIYEKM